MRIFDALHASLRVTLGMLLLPSAALAQRSPSDSSVAFTHATVIDGAGGPPQGGMTVVVRGGRIVRVGKDETVRVLHGARIIDARGKYLTPGFWDMHVHVAKAGSSSLALFIANGITSVRDMGGDFAMIRSLRDSVRAGTRVGPRITAPGPMLEDAANVARMLSEGTVEPVARFRVPVATAADAERVVDSLAKLGVDFVKIRTVASLEAYLALGKAVRDHGLTLVGHIDCAQICGTSADYMLRGSHLHTQTCATCAEVCRACAESCERMGDDSVMRRCAETCRRCAESCGRMAHAGTHH